MTLLHTLILGVVEGLTEFLPISSTAHLIFSSRLLGLIQTPFQTLFEVVIQVGAIGAVLFLYKKQLFTLALLKRLCVSFIPTAVIGLLLHRVIKTVFFQSNLLIALSLIGVGIVFIVVEKRKPKLSKSLASLSFQQALLIGLMQSLAVVPGVSRAGIVMLTLMLMGYKREESARYSFLLALPTIGAAAVLDLVKAQDMVLSGNQIGLIGLGMLVAFVSAYVSIRWFVKYLHIHTLIPFGLYRIAVGIISLIL